MSRLNGRKAILKHLGYSEENHRAWKELRVRYASILRWHSLRRKPWTTSEELDEFDRASPLTKGRIVAGKPSAQLKTPEAAYKQKQLSSGCEVCGWSFAAQPTIVNLHHLPSDRTAIKTPNDRFILLCPNHHAILHAIPAFQDRAMTKLALLESLRKL